MKIAQIVCSYPPYRSGIGKSAEDIDIFLKSHGYESCVFTPAYSDIYTYENKNVKFLKPIIKWGNAAFLPQLFFKLLSFDIVYLHYPFFGTAEVVFLAKLFFRKKFKLVIHYHMDILDLGLIKKLFLLPHLLIKRKLFSLTDTVVVASLDYIKSSQIKNIYKRIPDKFIEIPFSIDTQRFIPSKQQHQQLKILFVGGMDKAHNFKGVNVLLQAFAGLNNKDINLVLVGNGVLIKDYKKQAQDLQISEQVNFLSDINDKEKIEIYQQADIFVLPSINNHEAFGIVLLEAMSCGVPVIASRLPGVRKVFLDKQEGLLVEPGSALDLREKLKILINDPSKRQRMSQAARKLAKEKYNQNKNNQYLEKILNK